MALAIKAIVSRGVRANGVQEQGCAVPRLKLSADNGYVLHQSENISSAPMQRHLKAEYLFHILLFSKTTRDFNLEEKAIKTKQTNKKQNKTKTAPKNDAISASLRELCSSRIIKNSRFYSVVSSSWVCFLLQDRILLLILTHLSSHPVLLNTSCIFIPKHYFIVAFVLDISSLKFSR